MDFSNKPATIFVLNWQIVLMSLNTDKQTGAKRVAVFHKMFQNTCKKFWNTDFNLALLQVLTDFAFVKCFWLQQVWHVL